MNRLIALSMQKEFTTQRLDLAALSHDDAKFVLELTNTDGWLQFIGDRNIHTPLQAKEYINKIDHNPAAKYWKVSLKKTQAPIGIITLIKRDYLEDFDIGFAFLPQYAKKGFAFEATKVVLDEVLHQTDSQQIFAVTQSDNVKSINLLNRLGLKLNNSITLEEKDLDVYAISMKTTGGTDLSELITNMQPILNDGEYVFASVSNITSIPRELTICEIKEREGITVVVSKKDAEQLGLAFDFIASWITLNIHSSLEAVGLTAAFSSALTKNNISCNVIAGYYHDHIFVDTKDKDKALRVLWEMTMKK